MLLKDVLKRENNNIDLIRILAAVLVIWNHSFALSPSPGRFGSAYGGIAVPVFAFISGLVITNSVLNKENGLKFLISVFSRLYFPYIMAILFCALVIGPLFSQYDIMSYFKDYYKDIYIYI